MFSKELNKKITGYYEAYYKLCGLKNYLALAQARLNEEVIESKRMWALQEVLGFKFAPPQKHFIMGAGAGGLAVVLKQEYGVEVSGCEPDTVALDIIKEKLKEKAINSAGFTGDFGEALSFESNQFDFVHCFTVLEHVQDVEKCLQEMIRIAKPNGLIYINTPNYDFPEERHYKIRFPFGPATMPRFFSYLYLFLRGLPLQFFKGLNLLTKKELNKMLSRYSDIEFTEFGPPQTQEILVVKLTQLV